MLYSTSTVHDNRQCTNNAICIDGQNSVLNGDMFAPSPSTFPPPNPTTMGGTIFVAGGAASAGSGFLESWWVTFQGNNGSYNGTGPSIGAHCIFPDPPPPDPDQYVGTTPPCTIPATPDRDGVLRTALAGFGVDE
jgi:hypothetical protein